MNKKTRIDVKIFKPGNILEYITPMIAQANGNGGGLTPQDIAGYINCMKHAADYRRKWSYTITENGDGMVITEDGGETAVFSLAWIELHELQPVEGENLPTKTEDAPDHLKAVGEASPAYGLHDAGSFPKGWDKQ